MPVFYVIYVDIIFLINFVMDFGLLMLVKKIRKLAATGFRLICAAAAGAAGITGLALISLPAVMEGMIAVLLLPALMLFCAFGFKNMKTNILNLITLYTSGFLAGGIFNFIFYHTNIKHCLFNRLYPQRGADFPLIYYIVSGVLAFGLSFSLVKVFLRTKVKQRHLYETVLTIHGRRIAACGLMDTGNHLYDPITHKPVSIAEAGFLKKYLEEMDREKIRAIPFQSIGKENGIIFAVMIDAIELKGGPENPDVQPLVALYDRPLSADGSYQLILHPDLLKSNGQ